MGLLNHFFGDKKGIAKELVMDDKKRMALWRKHLSNYKKREELCKHFSFGNVDRALQDFNATDNVLGQIESLISPELISISHEEKLDKEILADLKRLKSIAKIEGLLETVFYERRKQAALLKIFHEIHDVLKAELHLIRIIRKRPSKDLLLRLFTLINHHEAMLYKVFMKEFFYDQSVHKEISGLARAVILQQELKEEIETAEEKFARELFREMIRGESKHSYRKLAEDIFDALVDRAGLELPLSREEDISEAIGRMEKVMRDDRQLYDIIKGLRPRYNDIKIRAVAETFRKAYDLLHFEDLEAGFAT